ncbi:MAG: hypothetical protein EXS10_10645 [Phycisphaerales bacterium]|nr:hypothetical protein [Phycisphaerales bacterium]
MIVAARTVSLATGDGAWIETPQTFAVKASKKSSAKSGAHEVQNAVQRQAAPTCMFSQFGTQSLADFEVVRVFAPTCISLQIKKMGEEGFEPSKA